jgi:hypothetical protein
VRLGQANPWVRMRLGAPRRLLRSHQGVSGIQVGGWSAAVARAWRQLGQSAGVRGLRRRWRAAPTVVVWRCGHNCGQCQSSQSRRTLSTRLNQNQSANIAYLVTPERERAGAYRKDSEASWGRQVARKRCTELSTIDRGRTSCGDALQVNHIHLQTWILLIISLLTPSCK